MSYSVVLQEIETFLTHSLIDLPMPTPLREAMNYSLLAGGKRIRPVLCILCARLCYSGNDVQNLTRQVLPFAAGLEMIHTYSLIHDDLPAMDDDDLRRGRPSNHKAFDEATAILAGDALLTDAFAFMAHVGFDENALPPGQVLRALHEVAYAAGSRGMVGGQVLDMALTGNRPATDTETRKQQQHAVRHMQAGKTGAMFRAACVGGALLVGANAEQCAALARYAAGLGMAFQIIDDILDETQDTKILGKPAGSDAKQGKLTWPALLGLEQCRVEAEKETQKALEALEIFDNTEAGLLREILQIQIQRAH